MSKNYKEFDPHAETVSTPHRMSGIPEGENRTDAEGETLVPEKVIRSAQLALEDCAPNYEKVKMNKVGVELGEGAQMEQTPGGPKGK